MRLAEYCRSAFVLGKAATLGANPHSMRHIFNPSAFSRYTREALFLHDTMFGRKLHAQNVYAMFPLNAEEEISFNLTDTALFGDVPSATADLISLCILARVAKPKVVFEIGTLSGSTALHFAINAPGAEIYSLDLPAESIPALRTTLMDNQHVEMHRSVPASALRSHPAGKRVRCLYGDSARFDYSPFHGRVDLFFIDGAHSYPYVRNDTLKALECCRPGSVMAWHDYGRRGVNGVSRWLHEFSAGRKIYCIPGGSLAYMRVE